MKWIGFFGLIVLILWKFKGNHIALICNIMENLCEMCL